VPLLPGLRAIVEGLQPDTSRWSWSRWRIPLSPTEGRPPLRAWILGARAAADRLVARQRRSAHLGDPRNGGRRRAPAVLSCPVPRGDRCARAAARARAADDRRQPRSPPARRDRLHRARRALGRRCRPAARRGGRLPWRYGSTLGALRPGVPLVVLPLFSPDQGPTRPPSPVLAPASHSTHSTHDASGPRTPQLRLGTRRSRRRPRNLGPCPHLHGLLRLSR
jgi:hypothetical protein